MRKEITMAYNLYITKNLSLKQISKQTGVNISVLKKVEKQEKWDKIVKKLNELSLVYNDSNVTFNLLCWVAINKRDLFLRALSYHNSYNSNIEYCTCIHVQQLKSTIIISDETCKFLNFLYYTDIDCFEMLLPEIKECLILTSK